MMSVLRIGVLLYFCMMIKLTGLAQQDAPLRLISGKRSSVTFPFRFVNNLMIIPMRVNQSDTLFFILDTGVQTTLLTDLGNDSLHLHLTNKVKITGFGDGDDIEAIYAHNNEFELPGIIGTRQDMLVLMEDIFLLSQKLGMQVHGIIGYDVFKDFVVSINYERKLITFYDPARYKKKFKGYQLPISIEDNKPYVKARIEQAGGDTLEVKLIVDTGASHALSLYTNTKRQIKIPEPSVDAYLGRGLNGDIRGKIGRLQALYLGNFKVNTPLTYYPDESYIKKVAGISQRHGTLGADILKRFHVVIDYPSKRMILQPNSKFGKPFYYNMSGVEINTPFPNLPYFIISEVTPDSPGWQAGLRAGDELTEINNQVASSYTLSDIIELFQSRPGRRITVIVRRGRQYLKANIVLKQTV